MNTVIDLLETGFCVRTQLGPTDRANLYLSIEPNFHLRTETESSLRNVDFNEKNLTVDNVQ
jgi:hypothetical protein